MTAEKMSRRELCKYSPPIQNEGKNARRMRKGGSREKRKSTVAYQRRRLVEGGFQGNGKGSRSLLGLKKREKTRGSCVELERRGTRVN